MSSSPEDLLDRVEKKLKGSQPLLAIDYEAARERTRWNLHLLENDRSHEVGLCLPAIHNRLSELLGVVP